MAEIILNAENFEKEVLGSDIPVLVDFFATWCGPCRMVAPIVEEIANENVGKIKVGKVNVDDEAKLAIEYGIESIPALLVFKNGKVANRAVGYIPKEAILALI